MRTSIFSLVLAVALGALSVSNVPAADLDPQCVSNAAHEMVACKASCREQFQIDKDLCRNIDHDCAEACRAGLDACLDGPDGPLTGCGKSRVTKKEVGLQRTLRG